MRTFYPTGSPALSAEEAPADREVNCSFNSDDPFLPKQRSPVFLPAQLLTPQVHALLSPASGPAASSPMTPGNIIRQKQREQRRLSRISLPSTDRRPSSLPGFSDQVTADVSADMRQHRGRQRRKSEWRQQRLAEARKVAQLRAAQDEVDMFRWMEIRQIRMLDRSEDDGRRLVSAAYEAWVRTSAQRLSLLHHFNTEERMMHALRNLEDSEGAARVTMGATRTGGSMVRMLPLRSRDAVWLLHRPPSDALCQAFLRRVDEGILRRYLHRLHLWRHRCLRRDRNFREALFLLRGAEKAVQRRYFETLLRHFRSCVAERRRLKEEEFKQKAMAEERRRDYLERLSAERLGAENVEYAAREAAELAESTERNALAVVELRLRQERMDVEKVQRQERQRRIDVALRNVRERGLFCDKQLRRRYREKWREWYRLRRLRRRQDNAATRLLINTTAGRQRMYLRRWTQRVKRQRLLKQRLRRCEIIGTSAARRLTRCAFERLHLLQKRRHRLKVSKRKARALAETVLHSVLRRYWNRLLARAMYRLEQNRGAHCRQLVIDLDIAAETEHVERCGCASEEATERVRLAHTAGTARKRALDAARRARNREAAKALESKTVTGMRRCFFDVFRGGLHQLRRARNARELAGVSVSSHTRLRYMTLSRFARRCRRRRGQGGLSEALLERSNSRLLARNYHKLLRVKQVRGRASRLRRDRGKRLAEQLTQNSARRFGGRMWRRWWRWCEARCQEREMAEARELMMRECIIQEGKAQSATQARYWGMFARFTDRRRLARELQHKSHNAVRETAYRRLHAWMASRLQRMSGRALRMYKARLLEQRSRVPVCRRYYGKLGVLRTLGVDALPVTSFASNPVQ